MRHWSSCCPAPSNSGSEFMLFHLRFRKAPWLLVLDVERLLIAGTYPAKRQITDETIPMKAIVVKDQAAGTAGMKLVERPEPQAATNEVVVHVHASGFTSGELTWPSTWTDRLDRDRTPSIPGQELAGVVTALGYGTTGLSAGQRVFASRTRIAAAPWRSMWPSRHATSRRCRATSTSQWARALRCRA